MEKWKRITTTDIRLKEALEIRKKSQAQLSREANIDKGSISHYLSGTYEPKATAVSKLATCLNVSEMWLWGYDVPMERENKSPEKTYSLSEGEELLLELFRAIPDDKKQMAIEMLKAALQIK